MNGLNCDTDELAYWITNVRAKRKSVKIGEEKSKGSSYSEKYLSKSRNSAEDEAAATAATVATFESGTTES
jgi:hypothetical protein